MFSFMLGTMERQPINPDDDVIRDIAMSGLADCLPIHINLVAEAHFNLDWEKTTYMSLVFERRLKKTVPLFNADDVWWGLDGTKNLEEVVQNVRTYIKRLFPQ